ncbi:LysR substrate-binding domain-containing protein [Flavisphingomonas formosensis]|uniref:LysR substrate-binding domain-containing protein n=1 Tax=Flavisphingomonas formosensis TaxID=861534 RepID=UPI0018E04ADF|nr:LysR substrate-binding domain-containing protein [Sphingomonas formosensis]
MRFSLRHLQIFAATARHETISAAAEELGMSQSAASAALIELERRYDRPLFDRAGKRLKINETGRSLLPAARDLLDRAEEIDALLAGRLGPASFRLGATQTIGSHVAPLLMETYVQRHPGRPLTLEINNTAAIAGKIADFSLDLALVEGEYAHPDLLMTQWLGDELVLICNPSHPLASRSPCPVDALLAERWVVREKGSGTRQTLDRAMHPYWSEWQIGMELQQIEAIIEMVAVSSLVGCVSHLAARQSLEQGRIVQLQVPEIDLRRPFFILSHREKYITPGIRAFLEICKTTPSLDPRA